MPPRRPYALRRLAAVLAPLPHLQRGVYSGPAEGLEITTSDGVPLAATLLRRDRDTLVIVCHGFGASQQALGVVWLAEALAGPYDVLSFDWRGYGRSGGLASFGGAEALDLAATLAAARELGYRRVGVVAESMGGLIALATLGAVAEEQAFPLPDALCTVGAPADYNLTGGLRPRLLRHVAPLSWMRPVAPLIGFRLGELLLPRPLDVVEHIAIPLLIVHGDRDTTVPVANAKLLAERNPAARLRIYPGVDHAFIGMRDRAPRTFVADVRALLDER